MLSLRPTFGYFSFKCGLIHFPDSTGRLKRVVLKFNSPSPFNSSSWRRVAHSKFSKCETGFVGHEVCRGHVSREGFVLFNGSVVRLSDE